LQSSGKADETEGNSDGEVDDGEENGSDTDETHKQRREEKEKKRMRGRNKAGKRLVSPTQREIHD
jgi:U3 small nucleolar RNA-associated protein 7